MDFNLSVNERKDNFVNFIFYNMTKKIITKIYIFSVQRTLLPKQTHAQELNAVSKYSHELYKFIITYIHNSMSVHK